MGQMGVRRGWQAGSLSAVLIVIGVVLGVSVSVVVDVDDLVLDDDAGAALRQLPTAAARGLEPSTRGG